MRKILTVVLLGLTLAGVVVTVVYTTTEARPSRTYGMRR